MSNKRPEVFGVKPEIADQIDFRNKKIANFDCDGSGNELMKRHKRNKLATIVTIVKLRKKIIAGSCLQCGKNMECGLNDKKGCDKFVSHKKYAKLQKKAV